MYSDNAKTPMLNPVPTGVSPGDAGVDTLGNLLVFLDPGRGYTASVTVGSGVVTVPLPDVNLDAAEPVSEEAIAVAIAGLDLADEAAVAAAVTAEATARDAAIAALRDTYVSVPSGIADGEVPVYDADTETFVAGSGGGSVADADATTKGKVQLAGDLAGTAAAPTVPGKARKQTRVYDLIDDFGATRYNTLAAALSGTDSTSAFKTFIATAVAAGGGRGVVDPGFYRINGALDTTEDGYAQIPIPHVDGAGATPYLSVELWCPQPAGAAPWYDGTAGGSHGAILVSTLAASTYSASFGKPSVIGGPTLEAQGFGWDAHDYFVSEFTALHFAMRGIAVTQAGSPTRTAFDLGLVASIGVDDCRAQQNGNPIITQPTSPWAWGLITPRGFNHVLNDTRRFHCQGYFAGYAFDEHATCDSISIVSCEVALVPTGKSKHPARLGFVNSEWNHFDVAQVDPRVGGGVYDGTLNQLRAAFAIDVLNIEDNPLLTGDWRDKRTGANVYDPFDNLRCDMRRARLVVAAEYDIGPMKVAGGALVQVRELTTNATVAQAASTVPFSGASNSGTVLPARTQTSDAYALIEVSNVVSKAAVQRTGVWGITTGKARNFTVGADANGAMAVWEWFHADGTLSCPVTMSAGNSYGGLILRSSDKDNFYRIEFYCAGTSNLNAHRVVAGAKTQISGDFTGLLTQSTTHVIAVTFASDSFTVKVDGVTAFTVGDPFPLARPLLLSSFHGIAVGPGIDDGGVRFGDLSFTPKAGA